MNALAELKKRTRITQNLANPANQERQKVADSHDSHDSQGIKARDELVAPAIALLKAERTRLLALAAAEWIDVAHVHRLRDADVAACVGLDDPQRSTFLRLLADTARRHAGRVPETDTAAMYCQHCGPVWTHPGIAAVLPVVDGWPRALGCPWCFVRTADGYIPRPFITCFECRDFMRDKINPSAGMGTCGRGHGSHYAITEHRCASFCPDNAPRA